jgi:hypothetical protein
MITCKLVLLICERYKSAFYYYILVFSCKSWLTRKKKNENISSRLLLLKNIYMERMLCISF